MTSPDPRPAATAPAPGAAPGPGDPRFEHARAAFAAGLAAQQAGDELAAERHYRESLAALPGRASTLANLGVALRRQGRADEALAAFEAALAAEPGNAPALAHRAETLVSLGRDLDALAAFETLLAVAPQALARLRQAELLARLARHAEALPLAEALVADEPGWPEAQRLVGQLLVDLGRATEAVEPYRRAAAQGDALAAWLLAGLEGARDDAAPPAPPPGYLEALYDGYADGFERHVVDQLGYDAPGRLARGLDHVAPGWRAADAVDLGCGSGLVGVALRGRVDGLTGIDLSSAMLERARRRGDYARLLHGDAAATLATLPSAAFDLAVAADMLIHLGELSPLFAAVRRALRPGGRFLLTAEAAPDDVARTLQPTARYAHSPRHLRALAAAHGLAVEHEELAPLRHEQRRPVEGVFLWLRASD